MEKFFIVGCPRSGTTMVQQALNRHSQVVIPPETKYFFSFLGHSRKRQARHIERLNEDLKICLPRPASRVRSVLDSRAFYEVLARRYVERVGKETALYFGEKTPEHTGQVPRIRQLFPEAKIIALYRDGRDVALSLTRVPWASPDLYVNFVVWLYYYRILRNARCNGWPNFYFARYEDVVASPVRELGKILHFLGLPYEPVVAEGWGNGEGIPEREYAWKGRALQKITAERVGLFRRDLDPEQIALLERLGREALPSLGYRLLTDGSMRLPLRFLFNLVCNLSTFIGRLPWHSLLRELLGCPFSCCLDGLLRSLQGPRSPAESPAESLSRTTTPSLP